MTGTQRQNTHEAQNPDPTQCSFHGFRLSDVGAASAFGRLPDTKCKIAPSTPIELSGAITNHAIFFTHIKSFAVFWQRPSMSEARSCIFANNRVSSAECSL